MPDNYYSEVNDHGNVIPIRDLAAVTWADAGKSVKKNLFSYSFGSFSYEGVTFKENKDKTVALNGTATVNSSLDLKTYKGSELKAMGTNLILNGGVSNAIYLTLRTSAWSHVAKSTGDDVPFSTSALNDNDTYYVSIAVSSGTNTNDKVVKPMIRPAGTPADYEPSIPDNTELMTWEANAKTGVHQWLDIDLTTDSVGINNITWTVDKNKAITFNGTANATTYKTIANSTNWFTKAGTYILTGCPSDGASEKYTLYAEIKDSNNNTRYASDTGSGVEFTLAEGEKARFNIYINNGIDVTGKVFRPLLRLAEDTFTEQTPYAMTNKELTEKIGNNVYTGFAQGTTVQDMITTIINDYISNHNFVNGDTRTVACGITSVGYFAVNMTYTTNRVQGYVLNEANHLYIYHYNINNQTLDIKEATLTAVS